LVAEPLDYGENLFHYAGIWHVAFYLFCIYILFCKHLEMMGSLTYIHTYMSCPYVIFTLYQLLKESQLWTSKRYFSHALFSQLYTLEKWIKIPAIVVYHNCIS
jgi:hypothetical protein